MINKRSLAITITVLTIITLLASMAYANLSKGTKAPDFTLPTLDDNKITLSSNFKAPGKVVVLDIWATWCPPCKAEIPYLIKLHKDYANKGVKIIGVAIDEKKDTVASFAKEQKINYTIALDPKAEKIGKSYGVTGIPVTYIIDKKGIIRYVHSGFPRDAKEAKKEAAKIESEVKSLLK